MRLPIGSTSVSNSGGTVTLVARRGEGWTPVAASPMPIDQAVALLHEDAGAAVDVPADAIASDAADAPRFAPGETILWRYSRNVEMARVVRDDERGLVVWIPSGSARLEAAPADGGRTRDVALEDRFSVPWVMREATWTGAGIVRVAPAGSPWSVWFFRSEDGTPEGVYVNLELPHRRVAGGERAVYTRDLVLDLWIESEHAGSEDVWLKDADELEAVVEQGRISPEQAEAVRALADHASEELIVTGAWPLDEGWERWSPDAATDAPIPLPDTAEINAARARSGRTALEG